MASTPESTSHLIVKRDTTATREQVWEQVADGWTYAQWVVGNSRMRAVDADWPAPGSTIHHSVGIWPLLLDDETVVETCLPPSELVLIAKGRPVGAARITLRLTDTDTGCRIEMSEVPVGGPLKWLPERAALASAWPRNRECTRRLAALAERRTGPDRDH
ncbi:polyketide cyclase [Mycobacterium antarcticum]|uniref:SRPBCC family protein n=1 Tax=Mycolicibacterium sp. TUM20985 TaxID=3023370 RepID=UPI0025738B78|nr:SRPBCC family protein [Mycolicibacterium sp. TUM20985]BDX35072.1 polyketide cyclase [Mycolicibacterium sp. TUM20985]